ncbi:DUF262 domain-containing protein [uncultured Albimonas sp.]|uniref:GmrSD restriction endonuclease domain-containing protein n=1 Tax=uncultured Albimonas sp. TaxID=1331701 RepID=UPI0030EEC020|tara:strand:- start:1357 stop:2622 length:1266 start_codon:yes stop_codon:yes gene_type:complete
MICVSDRFSIGKILVESKRIDMAPSYQRESGAWSADKKKLFIDSLINGFDIPKVYLHDLRGQGGAYQYAAVDGKQRLSTLLEFLAGGFPLSDDFVYLGDDDPVSAGQKYTEFSEMWRETFKSILIDIVLIQQADEQDIEDLFSRLNNGEPLNAAEKRNAFGGDMAQLVREIATHKFFEKKLAFGNKRYSHYEVAAKLLRLEKSRMDGGSGPCDLKKKFLDSMVKDNKKMGATERQTLYQNCAKNLDYLCKIFEDRDQNLSKQSNPQMVYFTALGLKSDYNAADIDGRLQEFFPAFSAARVENNQKTEEEGRDYDLQEFGRLAQQGTNDSNSMRERDSIYRKFFLRWNDDIEIRDKKRLFRDEERYVIWLKAGKKCEKCAASLAFDDMEADHVEKWAIGGSTLLSNARCLCVNCNRSDNKVA